VWDTVIQNPDIIKITVISHLLGDLVDKDLLDVCVKAKLAGVSVFALIKTNLGKRPLLEVKADIDLLIKLYNIDGIFFDEVPSDCTCKSYFDDLYAYVKLKLGGVVILNVGVNVPECFGVFADILVVFDSTYANYKTFVPNSWYSKFPPSSFWHVVKSCPKELQRDALLRANKLKAGYVYITADEILGGLNLLSNELLSVCRLLRLLNLGI
jgi:hypothetical protein